MSYFQSVFKKFPASLDKSQPQTRQLEELLLVVKILRRAVLQRAVNVLVSWVSGPLELAHTRPFSHHKGLLMESQ